jgi:hypothetical protein
MNSTVNLIGLTGVVVNLTVCQPMRGCLAAHPSPAFRGLLRMRTFDAAGIFDPHGEERRLRRVSNH